MGDLLDCGSEDEARRLRELYRLDILDTEAEEWSDRITKIAAAAVDVPICLISLVELDRQWFKSKQGLDACQTSRHVSFCTHAIKRDDVMLVPDAMQDDRFRANPLVTGEPYIRFYAGVPLKLSSGYRIGTLCVIDRKPRNLDDRQLEVLEQLAKIVVEQMELRKAAACDGLTGALNGRALLALADREIARAKRHGRKLICIMLDLDHFKKVNDTHGHAAGDAVLNRVVGVSRHCLRAGDAFARYGGEEFVILLPEADMAEGMAVAERLRQQIADASVSVGDDVIRFTASFGVTSWASMDRDFRDTMARADAALYRAKNNGRNRVEVADPLIVMPNFVRVA